MCDVTGRSRLAQRTSRPRWGLLYATTALMLAALAAVEFVASPGTSQTLLRSGLVLGGFGAMALWARLNRRALDQLGWCECAAATITVRVIASRPAQPSRATDTEMTDVLVEDGATLLM